MTGPPDDELHVHTLNEFLALKPEPQWGSWRLKSYSLAHDRYWVDLERCLSSAQVLDWIAQVAGKSWATDEVLAGLVRALNDVLYLQGHLCGWGVDHELSKAQVRKLVRDYRKGATV
jgi:hypothetical protein